MKKLAILLTTIFLLMTVGCQSEVNLPLPQSQDGIRGDLGIDININESTIDNFLNRKDSVYRDVRMLKDDADFENIGGSSYLDGYISGFEVVPYPYLCTIEDLPSEVGKGYEGDTLFAYEDNEYIANYEESMEIIEALFPRDKKIFLMCGGGGYAHMTKELLIGLGYDENKIYNVGGYWYYQGKNAVSTIYEENGEVLHDFSFVNYHDIDFDTLTKIHDNKPIDRDVSKSIEESDFIKLQTIEDLNKLEEKHETFPLFVFLESCSTCAEFFPIVEEYAMNNDIEMYCINLHDIYKNTNSITSRIAYAPSIFIYKDGEVVDYLDSASKDDYDYYKSVEKLSEWFDTNININDFGKCSACTISRPE